MRAQLSRLSWLIGIAPAYAGQDVALRVRHGTRSGTPGSASRSSSTWSAMLFILFDVEAVFLYPWAVILRDLKMFGFWEMLVYIGDRAGGLLLRMEKGVLDWGKPSARRGEV